MLTFAIPSLPFASLFPRGKFFVQKALLLALLQGICARREWNPGHKHGRLVCMDFWSISLATRTHCHACSCLPHSSQDLRIPPPWDPLPKFAILAASKHICMTKCIACDCRCVRWSAGLGLVQAFWHKGQAAVMEELPLASKQSRSSQTGSPNLMSRQMFFFSQSDSCGVRTHALTEWRVEPPP